MSPPTTKKPSIQKSEKTEKQVKPQKSLSEKIDTKGLTAKKETNLSDWYTQLIQKAELADYAPIQGFMIIRPNAYTIWEQIQSNFNEVLKKRNIRNAYFPLLIPENFFKKEAEHAQGFAPELAYIEGKEEGQRLAIRPTSETIIYDSYSKWIRSWRDLPLQINQWCNVLRWEVKQTKPFLRTREFLWQEGHSVFAGEHEARNNMNEIAEEYKTLVQDLLAIPVLKGKKSTMETFAGAIETQTIEAIMPDGKALQCGTSHLLSQGFAKSFNIKFTDEQSKEQIPYQTSWGFSTRLIGAIVMTHGDDKGLVLPPKIALNKIAIVPILFQDSKKEVLQVCNEIKKQLTEFNPILDDREEYNPGFKFSQYELQGIPLRLEVGPKDIKEKMVTVVRRDLSTKQQLPIKDLKKQIPAILEEIQKNLFDKANKKLQEAITQAEDLKDIKAQLENKKLVKAYLTDDPKIEKQLKDETGGATSRFIESTSTQGTCIISNKPTKTIAYIAKSY